MLKTMNISVLPEMRYLPIWWETTRIFVFFSLLSSHRENEPHINLKFRRFKKIFIRFLIDI